MFHASRSILFRDGFREKSHYCLARFLENNYVKKKELEEEWVIMLDHYRGLRHDDQYGTDFYVTKEEAEEATRTRAVWEMRREEAEKKTKRIWELADESTEVKTAEEEAMPDEKARGNTEDEEFKPSDPNAPKSQIIREFQEWQRAKEKGK